MVVGSLGYVTSKQADATWKNILQELMYVDVYLGPYSFNPIKGVSRTTISLTMPVLNSYFEWEYLLVRGGFLYGCQIDLEKTRLGTLRCASLKTWKKRET